MEVMYIKCIWEHFHGASGFDSIQQWNKKRNLLNINPFFIRKLIIWHYQNSTYSQHTTFSPFFFFFSPALTNMLFIILLSRSNCGSSVEFCFLVGGGRSKQRLTLLQLQASNAGRFYSGFVPQPISCCKRKFIPAWEKQSRWCMTIYISILQFLQLRGTGCQAEHPHWRSAWSFETFGTQVSMAALFPYLSV